MKREEWLRERSCTRKRAFATKLYAEQFMVNVLHDDTLNVYQCRFCGEFHIGHIEKNGSNRRTGKASRERAYSG